jgi:hypothetical protein
MPRKKKAAKGKVGAPEHFNGFKKDFLDSHAILYQQSLDAGAKAVGQFYNNVARDFIAKFGDDDDFCKDPVEDPPNPWDNVIPPEDDDDVPTEEEAATSTERYNKLRTVSDCFHESGMSLNDISETCSMVLTQI